jgi:small conductance mechanosensitive channel
MGLQRRSLYVTPAGIENLMHVHWTNMLNNWGDSLTRFLPSLSRGVLVFVLFMTAAVVAQRMLFRVGRRFPENTALVVHLFGQIIFISLMILGFVSMLGTLGVDVSALVAGLGLTGFAVGFALKDALSNVLAGTLILIYRPFRLRDLISVTGLQGHVVKIDLRYTTLQDDEKIYLIPNSNLFTNPIILMPRREIKNG